MKSYKLIFLSLCTVGLSAGAMELSKDEQLLNAAEIGNLDEVKRLVQAGADVNARDNRNETESKGWTVLMCAAYANFQLVYEYLIQAGADVNVKNELGETALMLAVVWADQPIAECLIQAGADLNAKNNVGETALMLAGAFGQRVGCEVIVVALLRQLTDQQKKMVRTFLSCMKFGDDHKGYYASLKNVYVQNLLRPMIRRENMERVWKEIISIGDDQIKKHLLEKYCLDLQKLNGDTNETL